MERFSVGWVGPVCWVVVPLKAPMSPPALPYLKYRLTGLDVGLCRPGVNMQVARSPSTPSRPDVHFLSMASASYAGLKVAGRGVPLLHDQLPSVNGALLATATKLCMHATRNGDWVVLSGRS